MMKRNSKSQIAWEMQAYGSTKNDILESVKDSITFRFSGPGMVVMSYLSDSQEVMAHGDTERARQYVNIAKMLMVEFQLGFNSQV